MERIFFILFFILIGSCNKKPKFIMAEKLKYQRDNEACFDYVVINNYSANINELKKDIINFQKHSISNCKDYRIIYLRDCPRSFFNPLDNDDTYLGDNPSSPRYSDFLCEVEFYKTKKGKDTVTFNFYKEGLSVGDVDEINRPSF